MILGIITAVLIASNILILAAYLVARDECKIFAERSDVAESIIKDLQDEICKMNLTRPIKCPGCHRYCKRNTLVKVNGKMVCRQCAKKAALNG